MHGDGVFFCCCHSLWCGVLSRALALMKMCSIFHTNCFSSSRQRRQIKKKSRLHQVSQRFLDVFQLRVCVCVCFFFTLSRLLPSLSSSTLFFLSFAVKSRTPNREPMTPNVALDLFDTFFVRFVAVIPNRFCFSNHEKKRRRSKNDRKKKRTIVDFKVDSDYELVLTSNECDYYWSDPCVCVCMGERWSEWQR